MKKNNHDEIVSRYEKMGYVMTEDYPALNTTVLAVPVPGLDFNYVTIVDGKAKNGRFKK